jgi:AcrR family transcriptional regulator
VSEAPRPERTRDADRTRSELLAVATEVFAKEGYSGARVDEIADRTRATKRMIYYYFGGKEQLYLAVLEQAYQGIRDVEQRLDITGLEPMAGIRRLAELTYDYHHDHQDFIRLVSIENIHHGEFIRRVESLRSRSRPAILLLDELLETGRRQGVFRSDVDSVDVHLLISSYCVFQVANRYTFGYLFDRDLLAPEHRVHLRSMIGDVVVGWLAVH